MKNTRISAYQSDLPRVGGGHVWGQGNVIDCVVASVVAADTDTRTDAGLQGYREFTPCGETHMVTHSAGAIGAISLPAPALLVEDTRQVGWIEQIMDATRQGYGLSKACRARGHLVDNRISVVARDSWGGEIAAARARFTAGTPPDVLINTTDLANDNSRATGTPGLDVTPDFASLRHPVAIHA